MKKLAYLYLAASTLMVPAAALAQDRTVDPPAKWEDVPDARLKAPPPPPGTSWQAPPAAAPRTAPPPMRQAAPAPIRTAPPPPVVRRVETVRVPTPPAAPAPAPVIRRVETIRVPGPPPHHAAPVAHAPMAHAPAHAGTHHGDGHDNMRRHERVVVRHGGDDRRDTRVHVREMHPGHGGYDGRHGMEWDEYGDDRDYDDRHIYADEGDYYPGDENYGYREDYGDYGHGGAHGQAYPGGWYGYPGYYGGYGYYGMPTVTITETTVTHDSTVCCEKAHHAPKHKVTKRRYKSQRR